MVVFRFIGWVFVLAGLAVLGHDVVRFFQTDSFSLTLLAQLWQWIDTSSQLGAAHFLERNLGTGFNADVLVPYFWGAPALIVFWVIGFLLLLIFRRRRR